MGDVFVSGDGEFELPSSSETDRKELIHILGMSDEELVKSRFMRPFNPTIVDETLLSLHDHTCAGHILRCEVTDEDPFYVLITSQGQKFFVAECDENGVPYSAAVPLGTSRTAVRNFYKSVIGEGKEAQA